MVDVVAQRVNLFTSNALKNGQSNPFIEVLAKV
jgi:ferric iron reductase protein FhuF